MLCGAADEVHDQRRDQCMCMQALQHQEELGWLASSDNMLLVSYGSHAQHREVRHARHAACSGLKRDSMLPQGLIGLWSHD